jgi:putative nucleotidyltransferase with HDIG domain
MVSSSDPYRGLRELPPFPAIATKLLRVLSREDVDLRDIQNLIRTDAALCSELLRIVNSVAFGASAPISSIQAAVMRLGFERVRGFAMAVSLKGFLQCIRIDLLRRLWRHSLACGLVANDLANACSTSMGHDDRAYTTALLHDIGRLGLFAAHPNEYAAMLEQATGADQRDRERHAFGMDHCQAGVWLAERWQLGEDIRHVIATHHDPLSKGEFQMADVVRVANLVADSQGFDVIEPAQTFSLAEIRAMLPRPAQFRFDPEPEIFKNRITEQLDAFD